MSQANRPRLSLMDIMILVATTGVSLSIYTLFDNRLFRVEMVVGLPRGWPDGFKARTRASRRRPPELRRGENR
ncbi:hypothetical protein Sinac_6807 [Singulisphaera acidiphila DSM 18658]|uniref:Uncharacterized protein n=1 Tax=Singulisphaera acidiphila (strain ATCC BAA-1392 / DSM 18658 / VKM B-2454 / MOB10) TaxID=886293 RepID=L0DR77_SINAD|nr:hypothetical protein Sinac_6807 [Singulisphaera acidiphila DSM 18658]